MFGGYVVQIVLRVEHFVDGNRFEDMYVEYYKVLGWRGVIPMKSRFITQ